MDSPSFPDLPEDIARHILELAAFCHQSTARRLVLVSKVFKEWIEPLLNRVVEIKCESKYRVLFPKSQKPCIVAKDVKVLCLPAKHASSVLEHCTEVQNLMIWGATVDKVPSKCIHALANLHYLALLTPNVLDATLMPLKVSHLEILYPTDENIPNVQNILRTRPKLTHLLITVGKRTDFPDPKNIVQEHETSKAIGMLKKLLSVAQSSLQAIVLNRERHLFEETDFERCFPEDTTAEMRKAFTGFFAAVGDPRFVVLFRDFPVPDIPGVGRFGNENAWPWFDTHCNMWDEVDRVLYERRLLQTDATSESLRR